MNKKMLIGIMTFLILTIGGGVYLLASGGATKDKAETTTSDIPAQTKPLATEPPAQSAATLVPGSYVDYRDDTIASTVGTKLLFFHAPWCPQCRAIESDIKRDGAPDGVAIIKVDYDSNQSLRKKYGVTLQTTFVKVDDSGNLIKKYVAYDEPTLASVIKNVL